jgi:hypothetical protein
MSTQILPPQESCPNWDDPLQMAESRFQAAVKLAIHLKSAERAWMTFGKLLTLMEREGDLSKLGFHSLSACVAQIKTMTGYSRSSMLRFVQRYKLASLNVVELPDMSESTAVVFAQLPAQVQRSAEVLQAASTMKPQEFESKMRVEHPEANLEPSKFVKLTASQKAVFEMALVIYQRDDPTCSLGEFLEMIVQEWLQGRDCDTDS